MVPIVTLSKFKEDKKYEARQDIKCNSALAPYGTNQVYWHWRYKVLMNSSDVTMALIGWTEITLVLSLLDNSLHRTRTLDMHIHTHAQRNSVLTLSFFGTYVVCTCWKHACTKFSGNKFLKSDEILLKHFYADNIRGVSSQPEIIAVGSLRAS